MGVVGELALGGLPIAVDLVEEAGDVVWRGHVSGQAWRGSCERLEDSFLLLGHKFDYGFGDAGLAEKCFGWSPVRNRVRSLTVDRCVVPNGSGRQPPFAQRQSEHDDHRPRYRQLVARQR